jgi:hypothetical protein
MALSYSTIGKGCWQQMHMPMLLRGVLSLPLRPSASEIATPGLGYVRVPVPCGQPMAIVPYRHWLERVLDRRPQWSWP